MELSRPWDKTSFKKQLHSLETMMTHIQPNYNPSSSSSFSKWCWSDKDKAKLLIILCSLYLCFMQDHSSTVHCSSDVWRGVMLLLCSDQSKLFWRTKRGLRFLCSRRESFALIVHRSWIRLGWELNGMIEIFNHRPNSSESRDEMQTKRSFGKNDADYRILLLVHRDTGNHSAVWYRLVGCAWCYCVLFTHPEEYDDYDQCFLSLAPS